MVCFDLTVPAEGDLHIDFHHTTEDVGIVLGAAFARALADKRGIRRFGNAVIPMDESLAEAVVDISGRPFLAWNVSFERPKIGEMDTELFEEFFRALAFNAMVTLHITQRPVTMRITLPKPASKRPPEPCGGGGTRSAGRGRHSVHQGGALRIYTALLKPTPNPFWCVRDFPGVR